MIILDLLRKRLTSAAILRHEDWQMPALRPQTRMAAQAASSPEVAFTRQRQVHTQNPDLYMYICEYVYTYTYVYIYIISLYDYMYTFV